MKNCRRFRNRCRFFRFLGFLGLLSFLIGRVVAQETLDLEALGLAAPPRQPATGLPTEQAPPPAAPAVKGPALAATVEKIVYSGSPIALTLPVGQWKVITFPSATIKVGKMALLEDTLTVKAVSAEVHLLARQPFSAAPILVEELTQEGRTFVLYVTAVTQGASGARVEVLAEALTTDTTEPDSPTPGYDKVTLTRYALQQLYAEPRLIQPLPGVMPVAVDNAPVALVRATAAGGAVRAVPLQAWTDGWHYATAVLLENRSSRPVALDPRTSLRGDFLTATAWQSVLGPPGSGQAMTTLVLVSSRPFREALGAFAGSAP